MCFGFGWVYENHPNRAWDAKLGCMCGAGMPCECNELEQPVTSEVIESEEGTRHKERVMPIDERALG
jgi:hypothetical protein